MRIIKSHLCQNHKMSGNFQQRALLVMNKLRKLHQAPPLVLDSQMSQKAQSCADYYAKRGKMDHSFNIAPFGLNFDWSGHVGAVVAVDQSVNRWYAQSKKYKFTGDRSGMGGPHTAHFTQMVWTSSTRCGVGVAMAQDGKSAVVVLFTPAGNMSGQFNDNVKPSTAYR